MKPTQPGGPGAISAGDSYLPQHGNGGYRITRYELDLGYRVAANRLTGRVLISAFATQTLTRFSLDLANLTVSKVLVNGRRAAKFVVRGRKLNITPEQPIPIGTALLVDIAYSGNPGPLRGPWGDVGWEELADGVLVAGQPNGAPSWFPCNDHPGEKASYQFTVTTDSPYLVVANGTLVRRQVRAAQTTWVFDQPEPMATYLATLHIGQYEMLDFAKTPVRQRVAVPPRLRNLARIDLGRQAEMMVAFQTMFGPYPFGQYTVVVTDDNLEIPLEAQGLSVFGANFLDGRRGQERLVAHELAHQWFGNSLTVAGWRHIWLNEGFACYAEWLWSEASGGATAAVHATRAWNRLAALPQNLVISDPGPALMFDDRLYKRGALTLHALRGLVGDIVFFTLVREWVAVHRHGSVTTAEFVELAARHSAAPVRELLSRWLDQPGLPPLV